MDLNMFSQVGRLLAVIITDSTVISPISFLDQTFYPVVDIFHLNLVLLLLVSPKYPPGSESFPAVGTGVANPFNVKLNMFLHVDFSSNLSTC